MGCIWDPHVRGREVIGGSVMVLSEQAMVVSYRFSIALSLIIRSKFAIECLQCLNQQGVRHFGAKFGEGVLTHISQILT